MKKIQSVRGMNDLLPEETYLLKYIENILINILENYGYQEIKLPIIEYTDLFQKTVGEMTEVIQKEMYNFKDKNGDNLSLRPEGTAGCVRLCIENGLFYNNKNQRLWYIGPMFRHERPQKGRYRQFNQLGIERFGQENPEIDAELIILNYRFWKILGISKYISLEINSLGSIENRINFMKKLTKFFSYYKDTLDKKYLKYIYVNPIRLLDSKNTYIKYLIKKNIFPKKKLDKDSYEHFSKLCNFLDLAKIPYIINNKLVRGLDYYNKTVFEWTSTKFGTKKTICGGGRYDNLVYKMSKKYKIPAIGCAIGLERLLILLKNINFKYKIHGKKKIYFVSFGNNVKKNFILLSEKIRDNFPNISITTDYINYNIKKYLKKINKYDIKILLILQDQDNFNKLIKIKNFIKKTQKTIKQKNLIKILKKYF